MVKPRPPRWSTRLPWRRRRRSRWTRSMSIRRSSPPIAAYPGAGPAEMGMISTPSRLETALGLLLNAAPATGASPLRRRASFPEAVPACRRQSPPKARHSGPPLRRDRHESRPPADRLALGDRIDPIRPRRSRHRAVPTGLVIRKLLSCPPAGLDANRVGVAFITLGKHLALVIGGDVLRLVRPATVRSIAEERDLRTRSRALLSYQFCLSSEEDFQRRPFAPFASSIT